MPLRNRNLPNKIFDQQQRKFSSPKAFVPRLTQIKSSLNFFVGAGNHSVANFLMKRLRFDLELFKTAGRN
jgi:hypothetical protein